MPDKNSPQYQEGLRKYRERAATGWKPGSEDIPNNPGGVVGPGRKHKNRKIGTFKGKIFGNKSNGSSFGRHQGK